MLEALETTLREFEDGRIGRRQAMARLGALVAAVASGAGASAQPRPAEKPTFQATALNHIALRVEDVARARDFYQKHLGLTVSSDDAPVNCFMNVGDNFLALFRGEQPGLDHYCYTVPGYDAGEAVERLKAAGLEPRRTANRVYFDDADGLTVQVSAANR